MTGPAAPAEIAYVNGRFRPVAEATVPVLDRGFLFGDGVYEVIPVYRGQPLRLDGHLDRLAASLAKTRIRDPHDRAGWKERLGEFMQRVGDTDYGLYLQVTRGVARSRDHAIPEHIEPTVVMLPLRMSPPDPEVAARGIAAITREDIRWTRCDIKAITLLANVLLRDEATAAGAQEVLLVRDGLVTEGSASNVFAVFDGRLATPPLGPEILPGITRTLLIELAAEAGIATDERALDVAKLTAADEILVCSSMREVSPVTRLDGRPVGDGRPGPVWRTLDGAFQRFKAHLRETPGGSA